MSNVALLEMPPQDRRCGERWSVLSVSKALLLGVVMPLLAVTAANAAHICKPQLNIQQVEFSEMLPPLLHRKWTALVSVDSSRCATSSGHFAIGFSRLKENALDIDFREQFAWLAPSVMVSVDMAADEAVETYWIDKVDACPCARGSRQ
jgi:hypothetical protein